MPALFIIMVSLTMALSINKCSFPIHAYVVSCPTCTKKLGQFLLRMVCLAFFSSVHRQTLWYVAKKCLSILLFLDKVGFPFQIQLEKFLYFVGTDYGDLVKPYFMLITFFNKYRHLWFGNVVSDGDDWHHIAKSQTNGFIEKSY